MSRCLGAGVTSPAAGARNG